MTMVAPVAVRFPIAVKMVMIDLDGTLVDTAPDIADSANHMLADLGLPVREPALIATWIGNGVSRLVKRALTGEMHAEPEPKLYQHGLELFRSHYARLLTAKSRPYPGAVAGIERLSALGFELACITNKIAAFTNPLLERLALKKHFKLVLSGDTLSACKPDPLPLLHACRHFDITPDHGVLVGDSANDVQAARAAGMPVICVSYGYNHGQDVRGLNPDAVIDSLEDLPQYLRPLAENRSHHP